MRSILTSSKLYKYYQRLLVYSQRMASLPKTSLRNFTKAQKKSLSNLEVGKMITSEQSRLIEKNYSLVFFFIKENGLELDEWHGIISEALIKAVKKYDKNKGSFSNFFYCVACGAMKNEYRKRSREVQTCLGILESIEDTVD